MSMNITRRHLLIFLTALLLSLLGSLGSTGVAYAHPVDTQIDTQSIQPISPPPLKLTREQRILFDNFYAKTDNSTVRSGSVITENLYTVGDVRQLYAFDRVSSLLYLEAFTVRVISDTVEIWVANDLNYYNDDGTLNNIHPGVDDATHITDERLNTLAMRLENDIIPTDVTFFGDYNSHDGVGALLATNPSELVRFGVSPNFSVDPDHYATDDGKRVIVLVQNIRDERFYDPANHSTFVVGYYWTFLEQVLNRNIITIDSASWNWRQGAPHYQYEATLAHEFQHLIFDDYHPNGGDLWFNEGLSEFAEWVNGFRPDSTSHRTQWQDYPENALMIWNDQAQDADQDFEILADYQQVYLFLMYMAGRMQEEQILVENDEYISAITALAQESADAYTTINTMLANVNAPFTFDELWREFRVQVGLFGGSSDETPWGTFVTAYDPPSGVPIAPIQLGRLRKNLNFEGYDSAGITPYTTNYIEVGWSAAIEPSTTITLTPNTDVPFNWRVIPATSMEIAPTGAVTDNVLYSTHTDLSDEIILFNVTVPEGDPTLTFDALYDIQSGWDYAFVQVTTDLVNGSNLTSLPISGTLSGFNTIGHPLIEVLRPGFSGATIGGSGVPTWQSFSYDMSEYAGQEILLAFRYSTDWNWGGNNILANPGLYLDNIKVDDAVLFDETFRVDVGSIYDLRGLRPQFEMDVVAFEDGEDGNGAAFQSVETFAMNASDMITYNLGALLNTEGFDEAGERIVITVSQAPPPTPADLIAIPPRSAPYLLSGLPPSIFTSRNRVDGSTSDNTTIRPKVHPGDNITVTVTIDNLSRGGDLMTTAALPAYVAVPFPPETSYVADSLTSDVQATGMMIVDDLSSVDSALPAAPGVYWYHEGVTTTADIQFQLATAPQISVGDLISPTAHIANAPFSDTPSQYFTDLETAVTVTSPFALSRLTPATSNMTGNITETVTYTLELVNTDDITRTIDLQFTLPDGITLADDSVATTYTIPSSLDGDTVIVTFRAEVSDPDAMPTISIVNPASLASNEAYTQVGGVSSNPTAVTSQTNGAAAKQIFLPVLLGTTTAVALTAAHLKMR